MLGFILEFRQIKSRVTLALVLFSQELTAASRLVDMFLLMLRLLVCSFGRAVVMSVLRRFRIPQASHLSTLRASNGSNSMIDCPEREAIYIITNGGINDPDKA